MGLSCALGAVGKDHSFNAFLARQRLHPVSGQRAWGLTLRLTPLFWRLELHRVAPAGAGEGSRALAGSSWLWLSLQNVSGA